MGEDRDVFLSSLFVFNMAKKLKELPHVVDIFNKYLDDREAKDLSTILEKNDEYRNLFTIRQNLESVKNMLEHPDVNTGSIELTVDSQLDLVKTEMFNFSSRDEFKKEKLTIENYTKNKKEIIQSLLEEEVEEFTGTSGGYYNEKLTIINIPNKEIGRFVSIEMIQKQTIANSRFGYRSETYSLFLGNAILPSIDVYDRVKVNGYYQNTKENLHLTCSGMFLYKDKKWNEECSNFLHKKFSAKATVKNIVERTLKNKSLTGSKPEWVCNMELMS